MAIIMTRTTIKSNRHRLFLPKSTMLPTTMMAVLAQAWSILLLLGYRVDFTDSFQRQSSALQLSRRRCHSNNTTTNNKGRSAVKIRLNVCYYSNDGSSSDLFQTNNYNNNLANPYTNRQYFESNSNSNSNNEDEYYNKILDAVGGGGGGNGVGIGSGSSAATTGGNRNSRQPEEEDDDDGKKKEEDEPPLRFVRDSMINSVTMFPWMFLIAADKITNKYCYNQAQKDMIELEHYILRTTGTFLFIYVLFSLSFYSANNSQNKIRSFIQHLFISCCCFKKNTIQLQ